MFDLQFPIDEIEHWSSKYEYDGDGAIKDGVGPRAKNRGYLTKPEFLEICYWKTPRSRLRVRVWHLWPLILAVAKSGGAAPIPSRVVLTPSTAPRASGTCLRVFPVAWTTCAARVA